MIGTVSDVECRDCDALLIDEGTAYSCLDCGAVFPGEIGRGRDR